MLKKFKYFPLRLTESSWVIIRDGKGFVHLIVGRPIRPIVLVDSLRTSRTTSNSNKRILSVFVVGGIRRKEIPHWDDAHRNPSSMGHTFHFVKRKEDFSCVCVWPRP